MKARNLVHMRQQYKSEQSETVKVSINMLASNIHTPIFAHEFIGAVRQTQLPVLAESSKLESKCHWTQPTPYLLELVINALLQCLSLVLHLWHTSATASRETCSCTELFKL